MLLSLVDRKFEQAVLQSLTVVIPAEHDSDDDEELVVLDVLVECVEVVDMLVVGSILLSVL